MNEPEIVILEKCNEKQLIFTYQNEKIETDFFNITFTSPASRIQACEMLQEANIIKIQKETLIQDFKVYIFMDDKLLQKELIQLELAEIIINYPDYAYTEEMKKEEMLSIHASPSRTIAHHKSWLVIISLVTLCIFLLLILIKL